MARKSKAKAQKPVATKDLEPKDVEDVKGGKVAVHDISITKFDDKASAALS